MTIRSENSTVESMHGLLLHLKKKLDKDVNAYNELLKEYTTALRKQEGYPCKGDEFVTQNGKKEVLIHEGFYRYRLNVARYGRIASSIYNTNLKLAGRIANSPDWANDGINPLYLDEQGENINE